MNYDPIIAAEWSTTMSLELQNNCSSIISWTSFTCLYPGPHPFIVPVCPAGVSSAQPAVLPPVPVRAALPALPPPSDRGQSSKGSTRKTENRTDFFCLFLNKRILVRLLCVLSRKLSWTTSCPTRSRAAGCWTATMSFTGSSAGGTSRWTHKLLFPLQTWSQGWWAVSSFQEVPCCSPVGSGTSPTWTAWRTK